MKKSKSDSVTTERGPLHPDGTAKSHLKPHKVSMHG